jgi:hypothetical protein
MRFVLYMLLFCGPVYTQATVYYFSNKGNDKNKGTSASSPKRTLAAAMALAQEGNTLLFNRGDVWYETFGTFDLRNKRGVTLDAYGTGSLPVISNLHLLDKDWKYDAILKVWFQEVEGYSKATRLFVNGKSKYRVNTSDSLADEKAVNEPHEWYIKEITPGKKAIIYLPGPTKPQHVEVLPVSMPSVMIMRNTHLVSVQHIDLRGGSPGHVVYVEAPSSYIVFDSCIIQRANGSGIMAENNATGDLKPYVSNISITNCLIDKVWSAEENDPRIKLSGDGIFLRHAVDTGLVKGNTILNWGHSGISITVYAVGVHGVHHILVEQNDVSAGVSGYMHGIDMNGFDGATTHNIIRRNYFHDYFVTGHILGSYNQIYSNIFAGIKITSMPRHSHQGWAVDWYPWPFKGTNNWMEAHDNLLINNTFVQAEEVAVMIHDDPKNPDPVRNNVIANNIIYGYGRTGVSVGTNMKGSLFVQNNNFWNGDASATVMNYKDQKYSAAGLNNSYPDQFAANVQLDPAFENTEARNFRLTERSPEALRSGGTNKYHQLLGQGFVDYYGRPWDTGHPGMGAIQYEKKQN